jgi:hypothetical protein
MASNSFLLKMPFHDSNFDDNFKLIVAATTKEEERATSYMWFFHFS